MLNTPQPVGRGVDDPGFGEVVELLGEEAAQEYATVYDGPTPTYITYGVEWADFVYAEDPGSPYGVPFDHTPYLNCGYHDPNYTIHTGVDFAEGFGTSVYSTMSGMVVWAGNNGIWGNLVVVENNGIQTYYAHLSKIDVFPGEIIERGTQVGAVGSTGKSTGPHLHYGIKTRQKGEKGYDYYWLNPMHYLDDFIKIPCPED